MIQLVNLVTRFIFKDDFSPMELAHAKVSLEKKLVCLLIRKFEIAS